MDMYSEGQMGTHHPKHIVTGVVLFVAAALIAGAGYWLDMKFQKKSTGTTMTAAPAGEVVQGFPKELLVEPGAFTENSYRLDYKNGVDQPVLTYVSNKTLKDNIAAFHALLSTQGWQITRDADPKAKVTSIYATKGSATLNIVFDFQDGKTVKVTEAYSTP